LERVQFDIGIKLAEGARGGGIAGAKKRRERDVSAEEEDNRKAKS
jgi:hypothetical protein